MTQQLQAKYSIEVLKNYNDNTNLQFDPCCVPCTLVRCVNIQVCLDCRCNRCAKNVVKQDLNSTLKTVPS